MSDRRRRRRLLWTAIALAAGGVLLGCWLGWPKSLPAEPPYSESRYLNTGPDAQYIGIAACAECHEREHRSYRLTAHSKALADLDPSAEPPDAAFEHKPSGRSYRVYRKDGQLRHQEVVRTAEGKEIAQIDLPIRYLIGSGNFTRSYLVEVDGFLHESPITWYTTKQQWGLSPGYDSPHHASFERAVDLACLACHAGRAVAVDGSVHRMAFHEQAIGCENCHGPGSLHQDRRRTGPVPTDEDDLTIVHPGKLSRPLLEAICAACHLNGPADVPLRGRPFTAFQPGRPLSDFRIHYRLEGGNEQMTVVGHVAQLRSSACYQQSPALTCVACHDPHQRAAPKDSVAYYRQKCLSCHATHGCRLEPAERLKKDATDNCAGCHMPRGSTEIPHVAFTHHRIGRHSAPRSVVDRIPDLVAEDDAGLAPLDRQRGLGLAHLEAAQRPQRRLCRCVPQAGARRARCGVCRGDARRRHAAGAGGALLARGLRPRRRLCRASAQDDGSLGQGSFPGADGASS